MSTPILLVSIAGYDPYWLILALVLLVLGVYVAISRQALAVFSRKRLLEIVPEERRKDMEGYLAHEEKYAASLRGLDLLVRLFLVLSLSFGRWAAKAQELEAASFGGAMLACARLALELVAVFIVFLEILPGIVARFHPEEIVARRLPAIDWIHRLLGPVSAGAAGFVRWTVTLLGGKAERATADILEEEILTAAEKGERKGLFGSRAIDMIESIIAFGEVEVSQVMTPRTEMVCFDVDDPVELNIRRAVECGHSRIPMFKESKDNIVGILYVKDLLRYWDRKDSIQLAELARKPHFVPLTKKIGELFQEFKTQRFHIAIVLDEFGGTAGLITIEDIIEEIVGEITDEYEKVDRPPLRRIGPGIAEVDGALRIGDVNDQLGLEIPEGDAYDTIGGFVVSRLGKIPRVGDIFELDSVRFEIIAADERRIRRLRLKYADKRPASRPLPVPSRLAPQREAQKQAASQSPMLPPVQSSSE